MRTLTLIALAALLLAAPAHGQEGSDKAPPAVPPDRRVLCGEDYDRIHQGDIVGRKWKRVVECTEWKWIVVSQVQRSDGVVTVYRPDWFRDPNVNSNGVPKVYVYVLNGTVIAWKYY
jgi:hypothetical protein